MEIPMNAPLDLKLEVVVLPVSDIDRSKRFYEGLGWRLDADFKGANNWRGLQFTPPGSPCSIQFGSDLKPAASGTIKNTYLVVSDIEAARKDLVARGWPTSAASSTSMASGDRRSPGRRPRGAPTRHSPRSATPMAIASCSKRSRRAFPAAGRAISTFAR
jgi:catechol 2,3-dioxygenase-like lactoylglutathione lyase family enzyme